MEKNVKFYFYVSVALFVAAGVLVGLTFGIEGPMYFNLIALVVIIVAGALQINKVFSISPNELHSPDLIKKESLTNEELIKIAMSSPRNIDLEKIILLRKNPLTADDFVKLINKLPLQRSDYSQSSYAEVLNSKLSYEILWYMINNQTDKSLILEIARKLLFDADKIDPSWASDKNSENVSSEPSA